MATPEKHRQARDLMQAFAERTGLTSPREPRRYLWTDAFAVCNFLGLARSGDPGGTERGLALRLVDQVHRVLGRFRPGDERQGWISGLPPPVAEAHPTAGGLRIGKPLPERTPSEPMDAKLEWDRDGQYFHYLTQWMHALDRVSQETGEARFNGWARELAAVAFDRFSAPFGGRGLAWKMSTDLTRALVRTQGQHDPIDGYVVIEELQATAKRLPQPIDGPSLVAEGRGLLSMARLDDLATSDMLGAGSLLVQAWRLERVEDLGAAGAGLQQRLLDAALASVRHARLRGGPETRLAFRELGLAIGLHAAEAVDPARLDRESRCLLEEIADYASLGAAIEDFWLEPTHRQSSTWLDHQDINEVMLATSLAPAGYLGTRPGPSDA
jgi:hypothetical protein